jgi:uncharacterized protein (DUF924 family)
MDHARTVLDFWFGRGPITEARIAERMAFWFGGDEPRTMLAVRDREIELRFRGLVDRARDGTLDHWADSPRQRLALIIALDQFPRNLYRGRKEAYDSDARALQLTIQGMQDAADATLDHIERIFFYMPLQHAEDLEMQDESVAAYRRLLAEGPSELQPTLTNVLKYAEKHRDIIVRYGRFPHRNGVLGRAPSDEETRYMNRVGEFFGQR